MDIRGIGENLVKTIAPDIKKLTEQLEPITKNLATNAQIFSRMFNEIHINQQHIGTQMAKLAEALAPIADQSNKLAEALAPIAEQSQKLAETLAPIAEQSQKLAETLAPIADQSNKLAEALVPIAKQWEKQIKIRVHDMQPLVHQVNEIYRGIKDEKDTVEQLENIAAIMDISINNIADLYNLANKREQLLKLEIKPTISLWPLIIL
jgi:ABC-type transporter Mla subunit MlaD